MKNIQRVSSSVKLYMWSIGGYNPRLQRYCWFFIECRGAIIPFLWNKVYYNLTRHGLFEDVASSHQWYGAFHVLLVTMNVWGESVKYFLLRNVTWGEFGRLGSLENTLIMRCNHCHNWCLIVVKCRLIVKGSN